MTRPSPFRGSTGTPLCTIHEDKKLKIATRDWFMGRPRKEGESNINIKVATTNVPPPRKKQDGYFTDEDVNGDCWKLPSAGVGERIVDGKIRLDPEIEERIRTTGPVMNPKFGMMERYPGELDLAQARWREARRRMLRQRIERRVRKGYDVSHMSDDPGHPNDPQSEESETDIPGPDSEPEEANEWTPSAGLPPDAIAYLRKLHIRARELEEEKRVAGERAKVERERELAERIAADRERAERNAIRTAVEVAQAEQAQQIAKAAHPKVRRDPKPTAAERARAAVENEPHSPSWNGSTYIDGREHHYCGSDFPCQMSPRCEPSIQELWERGVPVRSQHQQTRSPFLGPVRALFGGRKMPAPRYKKPISVESIRVGNSAATTIVEAPQETVVEEEKGKGRGECRTKRGLKKFWSFWTFGGAKGGSRRGVIVSRSQDNVVVTEPLANRSVTRENDDILGISLGNGEENRERDL
ncbi:hypothetical protein V492_05856 [Pseudogymnoascus sp. VKM F-4246]|nr:hypothetical protein V492_05856 [Pseudogymnoascus sp. VKM F-4246]